MRLPTPRKGGLRNVAVADAVAIAVTVDQAKATREGQKWALLVSAPSGEYAHEATICHSYQVP